MSNKPRQCNQCGEVMLKASCPELAHTPSLLICESCCAVQWQDVENKPTAAPLGLRVRITSYGAILCLKENCA